MAKGNGKMAAASDKDISDKLERISRHQVAGRFKEAGALIDELLLGDPNNAQILHHKGYNLVQQGNLTDGEDMLRRALEMSPENPIQLTDFGVFLAQRGKTEDAIKMFRNATELAPNYSLAHSNLGAALFLEKKFAEARKHLEKAVDLEPGLMDACINLGTTCLQLQDFNKAIDAFFRALAIDPQSVKAHTKVAAGLYRLERYEAAEHHAKRALELNPEYWEAYLHLGNAAASSGRIEDACTALRTICDRPPFAIAALSRLVHLRRIEKGSPDLKTLEGRLERLEEMDDERRMTLQFAAGKAFDDLGDYDTAFTHYAEANKVTAKLHPFDAEMYRRKSERVRTLIDAPFLSRHAGAGLTGVGPIFICGMPRSGTTLMDQMFSRHSAVQAGGELRAVGQAMHNSKEIRAALETDAKEETLTSDVFSQFGEVYMESVRREGIRSDRFTDKMPANYRNLGLLSLALPEAKFIIMRRHPLDCLLSNYFQHFGANQPFSSDIGNLAVVFDEFTQMAAHWKSALGDRVIEQDYEQIVGDPKGQMQKVLEFCNLDWEDAVLDHTGSSRQVNTASIGQVREPIYARAVKRWHNYAHRLEELAEALENHLSNDDRTFLSAAKQG